MSSQIIASPRVTTPANPVKASELPNLSAGQGRKPRCLS